MDLPESNIELRWDIFPDSCRQHGVNGSYDWLEHFLSRDRISRYTLLHVVRLWVGTQSQSFHFGSDLLRQNGAVKEKRHVGVNVIFAE